MVAAGPFEDGLVAVHVGLAVASKIVACGTNAVDDEILIARQLFVPQVRMELGYDGVVYADIT